MKTTILTKKFVLFLLCFVLPTQAFPNTSAKKFDRLPLFYWQEESFINFGDYLSLQLVERIVGDHVPTYRKRMKWKEKKLLAVGSIFYFAADGDVVWGSGINGKNKLEDYSFHELDVRAVRGPLTRWMLKESFNIDSPEIYGDPVLLFPYFFPEFKKKENPSREYIVIPHYSDEPFFPKSLSDSIVYATEPWQEILEKVLDSKLVISSALHGIIIAEAYGIPARMLRVSEHEHLFKYDDYYIGTNRPFYRFARTVEEAIRLGGEPPFECNLRALLEAFPFEYWPNANPLNLHELPQ